MCNKICTPLSRGTNDLFKKILFIHSFIHLFIYLFIESGEEGEREGEKHQCVVASRVPPTGDLAHNPGMCPDWESNRRPLGFAGQHSIH